MKSTLLIVIATFLAAPALGQIARDFMIAGHADLIKSDNDGFFEKIQSGIEVHFFVSRKFTVTAGGEFWTQNETLSLVTGVRWYPIDEAFVRLRGLIGANVISVGGGWAKPLNESWKFEAIGDVYSGGNIAIRAGFSHVIRRKAN